MYAFSNDPFKPLTEVERAFARAKLLQLRDPDFSEFTGAEEFISLREAGSLMGLRFRDQILKHSRRDCWRWMKDSRPTGKGGGARTLFCLEDVLASAGRLGRVPRN